MSTSPQLIEDLLEKQPQTTEELLKWKRSAAKRWHTTIPSNTNLLREISNYELSRSSRGAGLRITKSLPTVHLKNLLRVHSVRTLSGVAIVTVLVKPYACPGQCVYCPTEVRMPKSYIETEPAAARALRLNFDPYEQMISRLQVLAMNAHPTDKIELIVKGGTWSAYPKAYQRWFIKECYRATNNFANNEVGITNNGESMITDRHSKVTNPDSSYSDVEHLNQGDRNVVETFNKRGAWSTGECSEEDILREEAINETADHRIIGLTLETRPDWINTAEVRQLRMLGCTRVELGAQAIDDDILTLIKRGHTVEQISNAIALLREAGFKVDVHMMPQLPGATAKKDIEMFELLFSDPRFRPDMVKIYPCVVTPSAELYRWYKDGTYTPYSDEELIETLITIKSTIIPRYCRISRLIRDIPSQHIKAGNAVTNLREHIQERMRERHLRCKCLRCREVGHRVESSKHEIRNPKFFCEEYEASGGKEYFLSMESEDRTVVFAFCRLRVPEGISESLYQLLPEIRGCAFIRELHTYGQMIPLEEHSDSDSQHTGLGRQLMQNAEEIVRSNSYKKIAVIAGVGVREYYKKLGYALEGTYMIKTLASI